MRWLLVALLFAFHAGAGAAGSYASAAAWNEDATTLGYQIAAFDKCRGRLAEKPRFSGCIQMWEDAYRRWARMDAYAKERIAKDSGNFEALALAQRCREMGGKLDTATQFAAPELRKLGRVKVHRLIASEKALSRYHTPLESVLRASPDAQVDGRELWKEK